MLELQKKQLRFAVIGGGHGGQGIAAYLGYLGYDVSLYNRTLTKVKNIMDRGFIELEGCIEGRGCINVVTDSIELAIRGADIIMVSVPASAHKDVARLLAPHVTSDQYIILNPGRTGGALEFQNIIRMKNHLNNACIIEAQTLLFACRIVREGVVRIFGRKNEVKIAALPAVRTREFIDIISSIIPEFIEARNVLETSFNNIGALLHPIPTILNCGRIESTRGDFLYYIDGITPSIAKIIEEVDSERMAITELLGIEPVSLMEWLRYTYDAHGNTVCEALANVKGYWNIKAPSEMNTRYIFEDVPQSLVPISDMGRYLGKQSPTIDSIIHVASVMHNRDYFQIGRKVTDMGLEGMTVEEIKSFVHVGGAFLSGGVVA